MTSEIIMPKNVLVLNDSEGSLTPLIESLAKSGYTPYSTHNSEQCFDLFDKVNASTLLLSLKAHQALKPLPQIRQDPDGATIPKLPPTSITSHQFCSLHSFRNLRRLGLEKQWDWWTP